MKTLNEAEARRITGENGARVILEAFASGEQMNDPIYMRLHFVNNRPDREFYQKEPFILAPIDYMVEKLSYACFMAAALGGADVALELSGPKWLTDQLDTISRTLVPFLSQQYGVDVEESDVEEFNPEAAPTNNEAGPLGREVVQKLLGREIPEGTNIQVILIRSAEELEQILKGTGSQRRPHCDCPDCTGNR